MIERVIQSMGANAVSKTNGDTTLVPNQPATLRTSVAPIERLAKTNAGAKRQ
jgi:hypothetical protein